MKKIITFGALALTLCATSCTTDETVGNEANNDGKEKIQLGAGDNQTLTSRAGFTKQTRIVARIVSNERGGSGTKVVKTVLSAAAGSTGDDGYSAVEYETDKTRYWDDAHGRKSILSVYAVAVPNVYGTTDADKLKVSDVKGGDTWVAPDASDDNKIGWSVNANQTATTLDNEDLTYSNNIQAGNVGNNGVYTWSYTSPIGYPEVLKPSKAIKHDVNSSIDGRLYFTQDGVALNTVPSEAAGHFDKGHMDFRHSLSRIRVNIIKGAGYTDDPTITKIELLNQVCSGKFDIKEASWSEQTSATTVTMAKVATITDKFATYEAQMLPNYSFADNSANEIVIYVGDNKYFVTNKQLRDALLGKTGINDAFSTEAGKRYVFDITIAKSKIQKITATIVDWNDVEAGNTTVDNSHVTFSFYDNENKCNDVKLYKNTQSLGDGVIATDNEYSAVPVEGAAYTNVELVGSEAPYSTNEFYNDNNTAYHFRSLNSVSEGTLNAGKTAFTMTSGNDDYHWGAPMLPTNLTAIPYSSETGYSATIAKGIVAADKASNIVLTEIHMMSQLVIKLTTPTTGGVDLTDAEVYLTKYSNTGSVDMSLGKITPTATITDKSFKFAAAASPATNTYVFNVVPQELIRNEGANDADYIGITIKTKDNNEYYIVKRLSEIIATSVGSEVTNLQTKDSKISTWYPGHRYTYTFNIKKKEIEVITATIVNWNDVIGANTELDLEK